jgi:hypothetical protein
MRIKLSTVVLVFVGLSTTAWALAQTQGVKEAERFIKSAESTTREIGESRQQTKNALDAYNALVLGNSNASMKDDYKKLLKTEKNMSNKVADARNKVAAMDKQASVYFTARSTQISQIQDAALRDQAKGRLERSQKEYDNVKAELRGAGDALAPFSRDLSDQIKYLGADLSPGATASLKPQAEKLNARGATLFAQIDTAVATATRYFETLRSE